jgi:hypothetical protein
MKLSDAKYIWPSLYKYRYLGNGTNTNYWLMIVLALNIIAFNCVFYYGFFITYIFI